MVGKNALIESATADKNFRLGKKSNLVEEKENKIMEISLKTYNLLSDFNSKNSGDNFPLLYDEIISMLIEYWNDNHKNTSYINYSRI
jgi:hypothetical protein